MSDSILIKITADMFDDQQPPNLHTFWGNGDTTTHPELGAQSANLSRDADRNSPPSDLDGMRGDRDENS